MNSSTRPDSNPTHRKVIRTSVLILTGLLTVAFMIGLVSSTRAQDREHHPSSQGGPDLVAGLKATKGCLGVESADTESGKHIIFAWFENRKACLRWYYSDMHQAMMDMAFPNGANQSHGKKRKPLSGVPDSYDGPIMAIASITFTNGEPGIQGIHMPISQIAIELYMPLAGGLNIGGGFAPESMVISTTADHGYDD